MPTTEQLVQTIDGHIRELNREIASPHDARLALVGNGATDTTPREARPKPRRPATTRAPRRNASRKPQVLLAETAERILAESDGLTTAALAKQADASCWATVPRPAHTVCADSVLSRTIASAIGGAAAGTIGMATMHRAG